MREPAGSKPVAGKFGNVERHAEDLAFEGIVFRSSEEAADADPEAEVESTTGGAVSESRIGMSDAVSSARIIRRSDDKPHRRSYVSLESYSADDSSAIADMAFGRPSVLSEREFRMYCIDPELNWRLTDLKISEDEIHEMLARNRADGNSSVCNVLQSLPGMQRQIVSRLVEDIE